MIINEKLIEDSQKIEIGIRKLQSKLTDVIDRITDKNADPQVIVETYKTELAAIKTDLVEFLQQQKEFDETIQNAEKEMKMMDDEVREMMKKHNINENVLKTQSQLEGLDINSKMSL